MAAALGACPGAGTAPVIGTTFFSPPPPPPPPPLLARALTNLATALGPSRWLLLQAAAACALAAAAGGAVLALLARRAGREKEAGGGGAPAALTSRAPSPPGGRRRVAWGSDDLPGAPSPAPADGSPPRTRGGRASAVGGAALVSAHALAAAKRLGASVATAVGGAPPPAPAPPPAREPVCAPGIPDGEGGATWPDGSEYVGEWRGGRAHGRGVYVWPSGARYEGEWVAGLEDGVGTAIAASGGGTYTGFWRAGAMDGQGVYVPAAPGLNARAEVIFLRQYDRGALVSETVLRVADYDVRRKAARAEAKARAAADAAAAAGGRAAASAALLAPPRPGTTIYKGHASYDLMRALQMGILFSTARSGGGKGGGGGPGGGAGQSAGQPAAPPLLPASSASTTPPPPADFSAQVEQAFPASSGSDESYCPAFKWKDYAPGVFRRLRSAFGLDDADYLLSLTGAGALRELPSPGKSGSVFFLSDDDRFLVKTVSREEMRALLRLIPAYYAHVAGAGGGGGGGGEAPAADPPASSSSSPPPTLLTRFYGVHRVAFPAGGAKVRFVVMGNVFPTDVGLHRKFDIKGSTHGRAAGPGAASTPGAILKDLDVDVALRLGPPAGARAGAPSPRRALLATLRRDTALLERLGLIDYSLLLGIHYCEWGPGEWRQPAAAAVAVGGGGGAAPPPAVQALPPPAGGSAPTSPTAAGAASARRLGRGAARRTALALDELIERAMASPPRAGPSERGGGGRAAPRSPPPPSAASPPRSPAGSSAAERGASLPTVQSWAKLRDGTAPSSGRGSVGGSSDSGSSSSDDGRADDHAPPPPPPPARTATVWPASPPPPIRPAVVSSPLPPLSGGLRRLASSVSGVEPRLGVATRAVAVPAPPPSVVPNPPPGLPGHHRPSATDRVAAAIEAAALSSAAAATSPRATADGGGGDAGAPPPPPAGPPSPSSPSPHPPPPGERVLLFFGIIDFLQSYNARKAVEHAMKAVAFGPSAASVVPPHAYAERFMAAMERLFVDGEDEDEERAGGGAE